MEAGINADQNFYRRQFSPISEDSQVGRGYEQQQLASSASTAPKLPPKVSLATKNLPATVANGYEVDENSPAPDDFYRSYRGLQATQGYNDVNTNGMMTAAPTTTVSRLPPSSLRSNGNGTTPKHPSFTASRNALRPPNRSVSVPMDERMALNTAKSTAALKGSSGPQKPSVKDLSRRFDQNNEQASSVARKPFTRTPINDNGRASPAYLGGRIIPQHPSASSSRAGQMTRDTTSAVPKPPLATKTSQRSKFATEDQYSNNMLSSIPRVARARPEIPEDSQTSKPMVNSSPSIPQTSSTQTLPRRRLFGEVAPEEASALVVGYGIKESRGRGISDSSLNQAAWSHHRSQSDADVSPASPTAWYRGETPLDDRHGKETAGHSAVHNRSRSDLANNKDNSGGRSVLTKRDHQRPSLGLSQSRLPVSSRRSSTTSDISSPPSTRAATPSKPRTLKSDSRPWSPSGRPITPTTNYRSPGRKDFSPGSISNNNSSLSAIIKEPLPKKSPPLRSSRPRLPVSTATTASSRSRASSNSGSPKSQVNNSRAGGMSSRTSGRTIATGPVDFAAQRERVKKAFSRSILEKEEKELRAATLRSQEKAQNTPGTIPEDASVHSVGNFLQNNLTSQPTASDKAQSPKLEVQTSFFSSLNHGYSSSRSYPKVSNPESPTLGIPGSFPEANSDEDDPLSAMSNATGDTDFDNETQTEALHRSHEMPGSFTPPNRTPSDSFRQAGSAEGSTTGNDNGSIQIVLDTTLVDEDEAEESDEWWVNESQVCEPEASSQTRTSHHDLEERDKSDLSRDEVRESREPSVDGADYEHDTQHAGESYEHRRVLQQHDLVSQSPLTSLSRSLPMLHTRLEVPSRAGGLETPITDIEYDSSDGVDEPVSAMNGHYDEPSISAQAHRANEQSVGTDYATHPESDSSWQRNHDMTPSHPMSPYFETPSMVRSQSYDTSSTPMLPFYQQAPELPPEDESGRLAVPPKPANYSPLPSPRCLTDTPRSSPRRKFRNEYPTVAIHPSTDGPPYEASAIHAVPAYPDHAPPPPPQDYFPESTSANPSRSQPPISIHDQGSISNIQPSIGHAESARESGDEPDSITLVPSSQISVNGESPQILLSLQSSTPANAVVVEDPASAEESKRLQRRAHIIKELIDTESLYLKDMNVVEEIYKGTAEACPKLDPGDVKILFRNSEQVVAFSTTFLDDLKAATASVYRPRQKTRQGPTTVEDRLSVTGTLVEETENEKDRKTRIGKCFEQHLHRMKPVYTGFLENSHLASTRLTALLADPAVKIWLDECANVATGLTAAWSLDSLLIKPFQRITKYELFLLDLLNVTPLDHPDQPWLNSSHDDVKALLLSINDMSKQIDTVNTVVKNRKRGPSDGRLNFAKAFKIKSRDKNFSASRPVDDELYLKAHAKFSEDFVRLQVVLRDVEFYTREVSVYVAKFLQHLSTMELMMRISPSSYPEIESKWCHYNMSMRDMGSIALDDHLKAVQKDVLDPIEKIIQLYSGPNIAAQKRKKRRLDYEKCVSLKSANKKVDDKLAASAEMYETLNETLKLELPKLAVLTDRLGNICLRNLVAIQVDWYDVWQKKVKTVLEESQMPKDAEDIIYKFNRDFAYQEARVLELGIINGNFDDDLKGRLSHSTTTTTISNAPTPKEDSSSVNSRQPPPASQNSRSRTSTSDQFPVLPSLEFNNTPGSFTLSPSLSNGVDLSQLSGREFSQSTTYSRPPQDSGAMPGTYMGSRPHSMRPSTGRKSIDSGVPGRTSVESAELTKSPSASTFNSASNQWDNHNGSSRRVSIFSSAMPTSEGFEDGMYSSHTSSEDRDSPSHYNVMYLAASLFEFHISTTKFEANYPYLTYGAGEIFDVVGEKGELWLARNQDDPHDRVGWIWSKHFARLASD